MEVFSVGTSRLWLLICVLYFSLFNHIKLASELRQGCDYSLFKRGIRPMWEDDANKRGGRWLINLDKKQRSTDLDRFWLDVVSLLEYLHT